VVVCTNHQFTGCGVLKLIDLASDVGRLAVDCACSLTVASVHRIIADGPDKVEPLVIYIRRRRSHWVCIHTVVSLVACILAEMHVAVLCYHHRWDFTAFPWLAAFTHIV
jgi:hypothetical protein